VSRVGRWLRSKGEIIQSLDLDIPFFLIGVDQFFGEEEEGDILEKLLTDRA